MRMEQIPPDAVVAPPAPMVPPAPIVPSAPTSHTGPLGESDFLAIRQAAIGHKVVRSTARTALSSAVITLVIGISALPLVAFWPSWDGALVAVGVCVVGAVEYWGARRVRRGEPSAAGILGKNQLAFLGLIILYCAIQMLTFSPQQAKAALMSPEFRSQLSAMPDMAGSLDREIEQWGPIITYGFYSLVIVLSMACQGGLALYYFTRRKRIQTFNNQTPPWIRRLFVEVIA